jgi:hypothetical protein
VTLALLQSLRYDPAPVSSEQHRRRRLVRRSRTGRRRGADRDSRAGLQPHTGDERETTDGGW